MAILEHTGIGIQAISACVPKGIAYNKDLADLIPKEELDKVINSVGIQERRIADQDICTSDLCYKAAQKLFDDNHIDPASIDMLFFLSQTPDYRQPATAMSLQHRLGLSKATICFDVNLACSGYVYGLAIAYAFASLQNVNKILFLTGETLSKTTSKHDKATTPLFGDAGTATLITKQANGSSSYFSLNSDGSEAHILNIPYGGYRHPSCKKGFEEQRDTEGNVLNGEQLHMQGMEVFNFGLREVPKDIKRLLEYTHTSPEEIDYIVFHQANKFMTDFFAKKLKFPTSKLLYALDKYGNTSSASIPLTMCAQRDQLIVRPNARLILSGFGAGLSWGTVILSLNNTVISPVIEY